MHIYLCVYIYTDIGRTHNLHLHISAYVYTNIYINVHIHIRIYIHTERTHHRREKQLLATAQQGKKQKKPIYINDS